MSAKPPLPPLPPLPLGDASPEPKRVSKRDGKTEKKRVLTGLTCASCGGSVDVQEGLTNVRCRYCGTPVAVVGNRGVVRLMVLDTIDRHAAGEAVRQWFRKGIRKDPALKREARAQETFIAWFPFVRIRLDVVGWVLGFIEKRRKRGKRWVTVKEPVERQIERHVDLTMPAAEMAEFGVHRVDLKGDEILPLDEEVLRARGMLFSPKRTPDEVAEILRARALAEIQRSNRLDSITFSWLAPIRRRVAVVYYPLWVVRYAFRGRTYQVLVDAEDGTLAFGKAPGNHFYRAFSLVAACAGACFVGTTALQHMGSVLRSENGLVGLGVVGLILAGLVHWGYSQFRHGGVVEEGSGLAESARHRSLATTVQDAMEKFQ